MIYQDLSSVDEPRAQSVPKASLLVLQIADSGFPIGGFAHSSGLESVMKWRAVTDGETLEIFVRDALTQVAHGSLPLVRDAHRGEEFCELDRICDSFLNNHVANRASRRQGQAFLNTIDVVFASRETKKLVEEIRFERLPCHFAPVFGRCLVILNVDERESLQLFLFMTLRGLVSSAIRLGIVGPMYGQALQYEFGGFVTELVDCFTNCKLTDICQTSPLIDLLQSTHDRVYSRLFQS